MPDSKKELKTHTGKLVDYSWNASVGLTLLFGVSMLLIFAIGLAINFGIIKLPPQLCHYMIGNQHIEELCK
jgi:hypothetical protein